jgi:hypothetical protein
MNEVMRPDPDDEAGEASELVRPVQLPAVMDERPRGAIEVAVLRDQKRVMANIKVAAAMAGTDFFYRFPVKDKGTTKYIEGASIKAANAVARLYGNCSTRIRSVDHGDHWLFTAQFYDFETGYVLERQFQQRKDQKVMRTDRGRQLDILFQIGQSKAIRNVICNALSIFTDYAEEEAKGELITKVGKDLPGWKAKIKGRLEELKVDPKRVEALRGRSIENFLAGDVAAVVAEMQAIKDGMSSPDESWPHLEAAAAAIEQRPREETFDPKTGEVHETKQATTAGNSQTQPIQADNGKPAETKAEVKPEPEKVAEQTATPAEDNSPEAKKARKEQDYQDFKKDAFAKITAAASTASVDRMEDEFKPSLREADHSDFAAHCAKKARELMEAGNKKKK